MTAFAYAEASWKQPRSMDVCMPADSVCTNCVCSARDQFAIHARPPQTLHNRNTFDFLAIIQVAKFNPVVVIEVIQKSLRNIMSCSTPIGAMSVRFRALPATAGLGVRRKFGSSLTSQSRPPLPPLSQSGVAVVASPPSKPTLPPKDIHSLGNKSLLKLWHSLAHLPSSSGPIDPGAGRRAQFLYYPNAPVCGMGAQLCRSLDDMDLMSGRLYIFRRRFSPGHVKIGWTAHDADTRLRAWSKQCGYDPVLVHSTGIIPNAQRAETLVHEQLAWERRQERRCDGCGGSHIEWFEMESDKAIEIVDSWAELMVRAGDDSREKDGGRGVYSHDGKIRDVWARAVFALAGRPGGKWAGTITAQMLQESHDRILVEEATARMGRMRSAEEENERRLAEEKERCRQKEAKKEAVKRKMEQEIEAARQWTAKKMEEYERKQEEQMELVRQWMAKKEEERRVEKQMELSRQKKARRKEEQRRQKEEERTRKRANRIRKQERRVIKLKEQKMLQDARAKQDQEERLKEDEETKQRSAQDSGRSSSLLMKVRELLSVPWRVKR